MKKLSLAADCQKHQPNSQPAAPIRNAENRCDNAVLSDDDLAHVSAAGDTTVPTMYPDVLLGRHDIPNDNEKNKP